MQKKKINVSVIVVSYKVEEELINCISSIMKSEPKVSFEIIVVDNDYDSRLKKLLREQFPQVKYIKSSKNVGYGAGNNLGARNACGEFIFFLNPDTVVTGNAIDIIYDFMKGDPSSGMVAPLLLSPTGSIYHSQGSDEYTLRSAIVLNSFLNKIFSNNPISNKFFHRG